MEDEKKPRTPQDEIKEKLKLARARYRQAEKLLVEIEQGHAKFVPLRDALSDKQNGAKANIDLAAEQRRKLKEATDEAEVKLAALDTTVQGVQSAIDDINTKYGTFQVAAKDALDEDNGLAAILKASRKLRGSIQKLAEKTEASSGTAEQKLTDITTTADEVAGAYQTFLAKKAEIDNEETGFAAQLRNATEYAKAAQKAKTKAESELVSVRAYKDETAELVTEIKSSKDIVDGFQKESKDVTESLKNVLDKATSFSLSQALQERTTTLTKRVRIWGFFQGLSIIGLVAAVAWIFYGLFLYGSPDLENATQRLRETPSLTAVISKILFTTPLVFAVYFTTTNFSHARDLRDKYAWKETVAKNYQSYLILIEDHYKNPQYEPELFKFSMDTIRDIYREPNPLPKKRKYNIGFYNKTLQVGIEEEDLQAIEKAVQDGVEKATAPAPPRKDTLEAHKTSEDGVSHSEAKDIKPNTIQPPKKGTSELPVRDKPTAKK